MLREEDKLEVSPLQDKLALVLLRVYFFFKFKSHSPDSLLEVTLLATIRNVLSQFGYPNGITKGSHTNESTCDDYVSMLICYLIRFKVDRGVAFELTKNFVPW